jgi:uncharacterized protein YggE
MRQLAQEKKNIGTISSTHGDVSCETTLHHDDSGQLTIRVTATRDGHIFDHTITVGADDGRDDLDNHTAEEIQKHLDEIRQHAVNTLNARAKVLSIIGNLK